MHEKQGYFDFYVVVEAYIKILICFLSILYAYSGILITLSPHSHFSLQLQITLLTLSLLSHFRRVMSFSFFFCDLLSLASTIHIDMDWNHPLEPRGVHSKYTGHGNCLISPSIYQQQLGCLSGVEPLEPFFCLFLTAL